MHSPSMSVFVRAGHNPIHLSGGKGVCIYSFETEVLAQLRRNVWQGEAGAGRERVVGFEPTSHCLVVRTNPKTRLQRPTFGHTYDGRNTAWYWLLSRIPCRLLSG